MRARNFSRRVTFFFPANSAWAKLLWWIMHGSLDNPRLAVCNKSMASGLNQRFPYAVAGRPILKTVLLGWLVTITAGRAMADEPGVSLQEIMAHRTDERVARLILPEIASMGVSLRTKAELLSLPLLSRLTERFLWHGCGFGGTGSLLAESRPSSLPADPLLVLGEGYLKCRMITAMLFEPTVSVESYPAGYFGEYEYEGLLASDRFEFPDEATLEKLFNLLVEVVKVPGNEEMIEEFFDDEGDPELNLADYRKSTGFFPEFMLEFLGEKPLRVEINLTKGRMLIQAGEKWGGYEIDSRSAAALRALVWAERGKTGE
jgi:hypothetical protein